MSVVLRLNSVSKRYARYASMVQRVMSWFNMPTTPETEFWALKDVSFELNAGEAVAIVGQNGAGKSTLLKVVTGTVRPTGGSVEVRGRISAILELGLGFNPDLTGRENVFQAGGLLGYSSDQLRNSIADIESFAEIGKFFDEPLRVYSSGMTARLAFALATMQRPDILIVDEVLSVGDSYFQHKSFARIRQFKDEGAAILLVTHSLGDVRALCDRAVLLEGGRVVKDDLPDEVVDFYNAVIAAKENEKLTIEQQRNAQGWLHTRSGTGEVELVSISLLNAETGQEVSTALVDQTLEAVIRVSTKVDIPVLVCGVMIRDRAGHIIWGTNTWHTRQPVEALAPGTMVEYRVRFECRLGAGSYSLSTALVSTATHLVNNYDWQDNVLVFDVVNGSFPFFAGSNHLPATFEVRTGVV